MEIRSQSSAKQFLRRGRLGRQAKPRLHNGPLRLLAFPVLLNLWPLLLLVSQKALVPLGMLLLGAGSRRTRINLLIAGILIAISGASLLTQAWNEYAFSHYLGFVLFLMSVPLVNAAIRTSGTRLIKWLSILTLCNAILAFAFYFLELDLSRYRGLNRIVGDDDATNRVFFETTSLIAVFSLSFVRHRWLRWLGGVIVAAYALLLAKSVFVVLLFLLNHLTHRILAGRTMTRVAASMLLIVFAVGAPAIVALARPDFVLSVGIKLVQIQSIAETPYSLLSGNGWGYVIDEIVTSVDQPYQVEMQLPMLMAQVGLLVLLPFATGMLLMFRSISGTWTATLLRFGTYFAIGFANPWLLIPSWYLTVSVMYRQFDKPRWQR